MLSSRLKVKKVLRKKFYKDYSQDKTKLLIFGDKKNSKVFQMKSLFTRQQILTFHKYSIFYNTS